MQAKLIAGAGALALAGAALSGGVAHARAEPISGEAVEALVVTARWREEDLQETPLSIAAFTEADLEARNVTNLSQIAPFTPNLIFDPGVGDTGGAASAQVYIRGVGQSDFLFTTEPGVGIYVDGVYMARAIGSMMDLFEVERIEVLRGPQGTVFGKNSVGGAISVVTRRPDAKAGIRAAFTFGDYARRDALVVLDAPVVEGVLLGKLAVVANHRDGYVKRVDGGTLGDIDATGARLQLLWLPTPSLEVSFAADYTRRREAAGVGSLLGVDPAAPLLALWNGLAAGPAPYDARFVAADPMTTFATGPNHSDLDQWGISATTQWTGSAGRLRSITAQRGYDADFAVDQDQSPVPYAEQGVRDRMRQFSQEIQWLGSALGGRLEYVLGGLYFAETGDDTYRLILAPGLYDALEGLPPGLVPGLGGVGNPVHVGIDYDVALTSAIDSHSQALFSYADYRFSEALSLSAGLRQTWDRKDYRARFERFASGVTAYDVSPSRSWDALTPTASLKYRWTPDLMTYLSVARGYKAGGFNGRSQTAFVAERPFDPEFVWTYEAGLKGAWFERRLRLNLALFDSDYTDLQLLSLGSDGVAPIVVVENAGAARITGFELEFAAAPTPNLRLNLGLGHLDARYTSLSPAVSAVSLSSQLAKTPEWTFNLGVERDFDTGWGHITARADYAYRSEVQNAADNAPTMTQKGFALVSGQITFQPRDARWDATVFGTNLADERYITNGLDTLSSIGLASAAYGHPREWGVRLARRF